MKNSVSSGGDQMARRVFLEKGIAAVAALVAGLSSTNVEAAAPDPSISKLVAALHAHNPTLAKNFQIADQAFENLLTQIKENGSLDSESDLDEYVR